MSQPITTFWPVQENLKQAACIISVDDKQKIKMYVLNTCFINIFFIKHIFSGTVEHAAVQQAPTTSATPPTTSATLRPTTTLAPTTSATPPPTTSATLPPTTTLAPSSQFLSPGLADAMMQQAPVQQSP